MGTECYQPASRISYRSAQCLTCSAPSPYYVLQLSMQGLLLPLTRLAMLNVPAYQSLQIMLNRAVTMRLLVQLHLVSLHPWACSHFPYPCWHKVHCSVTIMLLCMSHGASLTDAKSHAGCAIRVWQTEPGCPSGAAAVICCQSCYSPLWQSSHHCCPL